MDDSQDGEQGSWGWTLRLGASGGALVIILCFIGVFIQKKITGRVEYRFEAISVGMTRYEVERSLGRPSGEWDLLDDNESTREIKEAGAIRADTWIFPDGMIT